MWKWPLKQLIYAFEFRHKVYILIIIIGYQLSNILLQCTQVTADFSFGHHVYFLQ